MKYSLKQACKVAGGSLIGPDTHQTIEHWAYDSRLPFLAEGACFLALEGPTRSGSSYIPALVRRGVRMFCIREDTDLSLLPEATYWIVPNVLQAIQAVAKHRRENFKGQVVGITGSNGKTIVKEWLHVLLGGEAAGVYRSPGSYNSQLGVALSILGIPEVASSSGVLIRIAIIEAGISRFGEMSTLRDMIRPTLGIFTNIGDAHDNGFANRQEKLLEKMSLFTFQLQGRATTSALITGSETFKAYEIASEGSVRLSSKLILWGEQADALRTVAVSFGETLSIQNLNDSPDSIIQLPCAYDTAASRQNLTHACLAAIELGLSAQELKENIRLLPHHAMRLAISVGHDGSRIIDDSFSNDLQGLDAALDFFYQQRISSGQTIAVLGELGGREKCTTSQLKILADKLIRIALDRLILVGSAFEGIENHLPSGLMLVRVDQANEASNYLLSLALTDATILIKGARDQRLDRVAKSLQRKAHEVRLEIDLAALTHNISAYRSRLSAGTRICVMVKAEAYGSGSREIARFFEERGVNYLAVAYVDEGITLRNAGSNLPIIVGNSSPDQVNLIKEYQLEPEITTLRQLKSFSASDVALHLKLDTGMHRLGFDATGGSGSELPELLLELATGSYQVASVFSHLSASDRADADEFSRKQHSLLSLGYEAICQAIGKRPLLHLLNSAGAWRMPEFQHDMVRLGLGIYGLGLEKAAPGVLEPAHQLFAQIIQIREVRRGEVVGYNLGGVADHDRMIGVVNIGYADGLRRQAGNGAYSFIVKGKKAPTVGTICMDFCMIDLSEISQASVGDEVEIFGKTQPVQALADCFGTITYEVFTGIGPRVRRVYIG